MSIYRLKPDFRMWDCWMFRDGADYHLFTLTQPYGKPAWDRVCHAVTRDWLHWEERPEILTQDTQNPDAWDADVTLTGSVFRTENGYGCIARVTSRDLVNWEYHPPLASPGRHLDMEVPQYFYWNGVHYLLYSTSGIYRHIQLPSRQRTTGTFYLMSDSKSGPYHAPEDNLLIGSGEGRFDAYVGKIIDTDTGPLLYHHICGYRTALAAPKQVRQNRDGTLFLERWPGLNRLSGCCRIRSDSPGHIRKASQKWPVGEWSAENGCCTGDAGVAMSAWLFDETLEDFAAHTSIDLSAAARAGVIFRIHESDSKSAKGWAVSLDRERSRIELCRPINQGRTSLRLDPLDVIYGALPEQCTVEMWVRDSYVEIYVNSRPCFILNTAVVTADEHVSSGRFGLFVENGTARFRDLRVDDIALKMMLKAEG